MLHWTLDLTLAMDSSYDLDHLGVPVVMNEDEGVEEVDEVHLGALAGKVKDLEDAYEEVVVVLVS